METNPNKLNDDDFRSKLDSEYLYPDLKVRHYWNEGVYMKDTWIDHRRKLRHAWKLPIDFL